MSHKYHVSIRISDKMCCHYQIDCDGGRALTNSISCRKHERAYVAGFCLDDSTHYLNLKLTMLVMFISVSVIFLSNILPLPIVLLTSERWSLLAPFPGQDW